MSTEEVKRVRDIISRRRPELIAYVDALGVRLLTEEERERLRGVLADELVEFGLGNDDEPTPYGLAMEHLVDWLRRC